MRASQHLISANSKFRGLPRLAAVIVKRQLVFTLKQNDLPKTELLQNLKHDKMKKSELLFKQADEADNDFQFWAKHHNAEREQRKENFQEKFLPTIMESPLVVSISERQDGSMYIIEFADGVKIDYYPKKDRVFMKKLNHWKSYGRTWILNKINRK